MSAKKFRNLLLVALLVFTAVFNVACGNTESTGSSNNSEPDQAATRTFIDVTGTEIELPQEINTVVHLWPASTAIHVFLGSGEKIVGTLDAVKKGWGWLTTVCPHLMEVESLGGKSDQASIEKLMEIDADVVITKSKDDAEAFRNAGIPAVCMLYNEEMDDLKEMILKMGELLGKEETAVAREYIQYLDSNITKVTQALKDVPDAEEPIIYYNSAQHGDSPLLTCGDDSIVNSWIKICGCKNAAAGVIQGMDKETTIESIIAADPKYVLVGGTHQDAAIETITGDPVWQELPAIKEGRLIRNPQGAMKWEKFGPEIALQILWFTKEVFPNKLTEMDINTEVKDFYMKFYKYELTDNQLEQLMAGKGRPQ